MGDLNCLCDICARPSRITGAQCTGNRKRLWVRVDAQPDPTGDPSLWRARYQGRVLPVHVFGDTPVAGNYYLARLLCTSSQYIVYIPTAGGGLFYVLYNDQSIYRLVELVAGGGTAELKTAWSGLGQYGQYIGPSSLDQTADQPDQDKVNIATSLYRVYHSGDSAATWSLKIYADTNFAKPKFDLTTQGLGWTAAMPKFDAAYEAAVQSQWSITAGTYDASVAHSSQYTDWYASGAELVLQKTLDGGNTWASISLGYLGQILPARMSWPKTGTHPSSVELFDTIPICSSPIWNLCDWDGTDDWWTHMGCPFPAGDTFFIIQPLPPAIARRNNDIGGGVYTTIHYHICNAGPVNDTANLVVWKPTVYSTFIAPLHDGGSTYVVVGAYYYTGEPKSRSPQTNNEAVTPFWYNEPKAVFYYRNLIYRVDANGSYTLWNQPTTSGGLIDQHVEADPSDPDTFYAYDANWNLGRYNWAGQTMTDITPFVSIGNVGSFCVMSDGTLLVPCVDLVGGVYKFGVYRSTNQGASWSFTDLSGYTYDIWDESCMIARSSGNVAAMMLSSGKVAFSTDKGVTWQITAVLGKDFAADPDWVNDIGAG